MEERSFDELIDPTCPSCRHAVPMNASTCPKCGYKLKVEGKKTPAAEAKAPSVTKAAKSGRSNRVYIWGAIIIIVVIIIVIAVDMML